MKRLGKRRQRDSFTLDTSTGSGTILHAHTRQNTGYADTSINTDADDGWHESSAYNGETPHSALKINPVAVECLGPQVG